MLNALSFLRLVLPHPFLYMFLLPGSKEGVRSSAFVLRAHGVRDT